MNDNLFKFLVIIQLMGLLILPAKECKAEDWVAVSATSYHFSDQKFNKNNLGIGFERHFENDLLLMGGMYDNSVYRNSTYALVGWTPLQYGPFKTGLAIGAVTGYPAMNDGKIAPVAVGLISIEGESIGANLLVIPKFKESPLTIGVQFKWKF